MEKMMRKLPSLSSFKSTKTKLSVVAITTILFLIIPQEGSVVDKKGVHVAYIDAVGVPTAC